jgi:hypothetical protein
MKVLLLLIILLSGLFEAATNIAGDFSATISSQSTAGAFGNFSMIIDSNGKGAYEWTLNLNSFTIPSSATGCTKQIIATSGLKCTFRLCFKLIFSYYLCLISLFVTLIIYCI